jgi:hypothetical protein
MASKYKVAREGKVFGEFELWEIKDWIKGGRLSWMDDFWEEGMDKWAKLEVIKEQILKAQRPTIASINSEVAPNKNLARVGSVLMAAGLITLAIALFSSPEGSAIRQTVLAQYMTNGILLMILGVLVAKK